MKNHLRTAMFNTVALLVLVAGPALFDNLMEAYAHLYYWIF